MVRRSAFEAVGPYDESLVYEDDDMWLRMADRFEFRYLDGIAVNKRYLDTSLSHDMRYDVARRVSKATVLLKWGGRDQVRDRVIADRVWPIARRVLAEDPASARELLEQTYELAPSPSRRAFLEFARMPGGAALLRECFRARDRTKPYLKALSRQVARRR
jgi:hypothetical protein